jgi:general stress protein YciG
MAGTKAGSIKAKETIKKRYGSDFYAKIGAQGGKKSTTGGFYANRELAKTAGKVGGMISKRGKARVKNQPSGTSPKELS